MKLVVVLQQPGYQSGTSQNSFLAAIVLYNYLRASAQENRAKGGHSRKPNLPSFLVYREVLTTLQTSWGSFSEMRPILGII